MTTATVRGLHDALVRALAPVTRWRHPAPGDGTPVRVNATGIDVWENHVGDVRVDPDGTAHAYLFLQTTPGGRLQSRAVTTTVLTQWQPLLTFAGGTPVKTQWGIDLTRPALDGVVLTTTAGEPLTAPLHEGFTRRGTYDPGPIRVDEDPSPPRWYVPIQYATQAR